MCGVPWCPSQETARSAGARCFEFALQGIRVPWERGEGCGRTGTIARRSPPPVRGRGERSIRAILHSAFYILHSAFRRAPRRGRKCRRSFLRCSDVRRAPCDLWILGRSLTSNAHPLITARGGHI